MEFLFIYKDYTCTLIILIGGRLEITERNSSRTSNRFLLSHGLETR